MSKGFPKLHILRRLGLENLPGFTNKYCKLSGGFSKRFYKLSRGSVKESIISLNERKKFCILFGIKFKQLKFFVKKYNEVNIFDKILIKFLSNRLDVFLVKLGLCVSLVESRNLIKYGKVLVNGYKVTCYGFILKIFDFVKVFKNNSEAIFNYNFYYSNMFKSVNFKGDVFSSIVNINTLEVFILKNFIYRELLYKFNMDKIFQSVIN